MRVLVRTILSIASCLGLAVAAGGAVAAFPEKPVRIIAPTSPGGGIDLLSRALAKRMTEDMGVNVFVENRPGGNSNIGIEAAAHAAPDGYTLLMGYTGMAINPHLFGNLPWNPETDFAPVALVGFIPMLLVTHPAFPPTSLAEMIAYIKARPEGITYAHGGVGGMSHLGGELFKSLAKVNMTAVPYKGNAPALADVVAGHVPLMWDTINTSMPQVKAGKLKALAIATARRSAAHPDIPTMAEGGVPGFELAAWYMIFAPKKTPPDVLDRLNAAINKAMADPEVARTLGAQGVELAGGPHDGAVRFMSAELDRWGKFIKAAGIKAD